MTATILRTKAALAAALSGLGIGLTAPVSPAAADSESDTRYYFEVDEIQAGSDVPAEVRGAIRTRLAGAIDGHDRLLSELPDGAPDPDEDPEAFEAFADQADLRAYEVHAEVTSYRAEVDEHPDGPGHVVTVHVGLRLFGEGIPRPTMDFSGDGSATAQVPTGRRVRDADRDYAHASAIQEAVTEGVATSLRELDAPPGGD